MADKIQIQNDDDYEPSDSEDEFNAEEKELIAKVRQKRVRDDDDDDQAVLAFDETESEDEGDAIEDSDIEGGNEYDGIPDEKAWGKKRSAYYNTDFVDQDYSTYNEKEQEQAQQEEQEAKAIQQRLAKQLDEADFSLDIYSEQPSSQNKKPDLEVNKTKLKADFSQLSARQKQQLFVKDSPEFAGLVQDFEQHLLESETVLSPVLKYAREKNLKMPAIDFVQTKNNLILTYCTNVGFYLILKSKRTPVKNHPVVKRLVQLRQLLLQLEENYQNVVKPQLERLIEVINSGEEFTVQSAESLAQPAAINKNKKRLNALKMVAPNENQDDSDYDSQQNDAKQNEPQSSSGDESQNDDNDAEMNAAEGDEDEDERRGITYQIAKNKGLTPHRKKEFRNPRVKHRNKYRKALIRRKGAVRTVRKETKRYGGEVSGIKASVKKGIKLQS